jgi:hypothetical protein
MRRKSFQIRMPLKIPPGKTTFNFLARILQPRASGIILPPKDISTPTILSLLISRGHVLPLGILLNRETFAANPKLTVDLKIGVLPAVLSDGNFRSARAQAN